MDPSIHPAIREALASHANDQPVCCGKSPPCLHCVASRSMVEMKPTETTEPSERIEPEPVEITSEDRPVPMRPRASCRGLSLVEVLVSLAITAALLTATMVAVDASFRAYASAAESASTQTATRLTVHKLLGMIRSATVHGPLSTYDDSSAAFVGDRYESNYITLEEADGDLITLSYDASTQQLMMTTASGGAGVGVTQPILGGVTDASFVIHRRRLSSGMWVLSRASVDLTVQPDADNTLALENGNTPATRVIASTKPRRIE